MFVSASLNVFECVEIDDDESRVVIDRFSYFCGKRFDLEPLRRAVAAASQLSTVAYVVVGGDGFLLANVREADAHCDVVVRPVDPQLARKHNKGGQSSARFGRLQQESRNAFVKQCVEAMLATWPALLNGAIKLVVAGSANLKDAVVNELPPAARRCVVRVFDTANNGRDGLAQAVAATLADVVGGAQRRADVVALEELMDSLRLDDGGGGGNANETTLTAIGAREVSAALKLHAVERLLVHSDAPLVVEQRRARTANNNDDDDDDIDDDIDAGAVDVAGNASRRIVVAPDVVVVRITGQSAASSQFLAGFGGLAARLSWPVPRELLE